MSAWRSRRRRSSLRRPALSTPVHFADGFDRPETIALGLEAPQMAVLAGGAALVWLVVHAASGVPGVLLALPLALATGVVGAGRWAGRPLVTWAWLAGRFALRARHGGGSLLAAEDPTAGGGEAPSQEQALPAGGGEAPGQGQAPALPAGAAGAPGPASGAAAPTPPPDDEPPWARWLREGGATRAASDPRPAAPAAPAWRMAPEPPRAPLDPYGSHALPPPVAAAGADVGAVQPPAWSEASGDDPASGTTAPDRWPAPAGGRADPEGSGAILSSASAPRRGREIAVAESAPDVAARRGILGRILKALRGTEVEVAARTAPQDRPRMATEPADAEPPDPPFSPAQRRALADRVVERGRIVEIDRTPLVLMPSPLEPAAPAASATEEPVTTHADLQDASGGDDDDRASVLLHLAPLFDEELDEELMLELADPDAGSVAPPPAPAPSTARGPHSGARGPHSGGRPAPPPVFVGATRRICFFSLNGGVGRTTLATEVGALLAARGRHRPAPEEPAQPLRVALVDLDLLSSNVAIRLGIPHPTLWDYLLATGDDADDVSRFMVRHSSGLHALLGPPKPLSTATTALEPARVAEVVHQLERDGFHFIVFDTSGDLSAVTTWVLSSVHDIYVVITDTSIGLQDAYRTTETLRRLGMGHKLRYVVNRGSHAVGVTEVMGDLRGRVCATIPVDRRIEEAENEHRIAALSGGGPGAEAIARLAQTIYPALGISPRRRLLRRRRVG